MTTTPNFDWYSARSKTAGQSPRCPLASAELCPRYYASTWLLASAGVTTNISEVEVRRLDRKWEPFKPTISEEEPSITGPHDNLRGVHDFCPEVSYDRFGQFASHLGRHGDELGAQLMHEVLSRLNAPPDDFRWNWGTCTPRHFTECREFSIFSASGPLKLPGRKRARGQVRQTLGAKRRWQVLARDSFTCQYCGRRPPEVPIEVDHRVPVAAGGGDEIDNLITSCQDCNRGKGTEQIAE